MTRTLILFAVLLTTLSTIKLASAQTQPNIIVIFVDDLGWKDIGCYGNDFVETPHIDALAKSGMRFTDFYASGAVCSPTRCALQSGQNQARIGITAHIPGHWRPFERVITPLTTMALPPQTVTIAETLKTAGYKTGYIGKWHLGSGPDQTPGAQGYDFDAELNGPHYEGRYRAKNESLKPKEGQYRTDFEADLMIRFIEENHADPFLAIVSPFAVHIPLGAMSEKVEKYRKKAGGDDHIPHPIYAAMIEHVDDMVGRIVHAVDANGMADRTMIVFTSDNGGLYRRYDFNPESDRTVAKQTPLRGEKGMLYEGGVRVPLIIKYPGKIPAGSTCSEPTITHDFYPTFVELAGGSLPQNQVVDGKSLVPLFDNPRSKLERDALHWHYPHYHHDRPASSIRERDWKLIEYLDGTGDIELYHLSDDIGESKNLAKEKAGRTADLKKKLERWRRQVIARMPIPNPTYDPQRAGEWWSMRMGKPIDSKGRKRFPGTEKDL